MDKSPMKGLGERLRARARELGLSDAAVARRSGLEPTTYAGYVSDRHEPDLPTFKRLCSTLGASATELLGDMSLVTDDEALRAKIAAALEALDRRSLEVAEIVIDGLVARFIPIRAADADGEPQTKPRAPKDTGQD